MSYIDDLQRIYEKEKSDYGIKCMHEQNTPHPEYEFDSFDEWLKDRGIKRE